jgi:uncharacterized phage protein gp47/JayE
MIIAPTLTELFTAISADFKNRFSISSENDLKRVLTAFATVNAGVLKLYYLALMDVQKNVWPDLADSEEIGGTLERFGRIKLGRDPYPAIQGEYTLTITGIIGATLPIGTQFKSSSESTNPNCLFTTTETVTLLSTTGQVSVLANNSGTDYELAEDDILYTVNPITNITSKAVVSSVDTIPTDDEDMEVYRELVLQAFRLEPNGGSASDYIYWALDVDGIRTVYPYTALGTSGVVSIYAEATVAASTDGHGTPTDALKEALWKSDKTGVFELDPDTTQSIYNRGRRQIGLSEISILSITPVPVIITITNLKSQIDTAKTSITEKITDLLYYKRPFISGVGDINDRKDTLYLSDVVVAISEAVETGNTYDSVEATCNGLALPFQFLNGNIPYLNSIVYA